jgi:hypothetical protein
MELSGLHLLLTYQCTLACDHCFVWGSPWQRGTMRLADVREILRQAEDLGSVTWIYFEGGEPFLYYPILVRGVMEAADRGFRVGVVTNTYWATSAEDAEVWLQPLAGRVEDLSISSDRYHWDEAVMQRARDARAAAERLGIPLGVISVAQPPDAGEPAEGESTLMYHGRAAEELAERAPHHPWVEFTTCPYEDLRRPGRVHVDPPGNVHICQGVVVGNLFRTPLREIAAGYAPDRHPIVGPLLAGGPAELARRYQLPVREGYADACHLCYALRLALRDRFPEELAPDQVYGVFDRHGG